MHILQPKHSKLKQEDVEKLLIKLNVSRAQLPKIRRDDAAIVNLNPQIGDIIKIERKEGNEDSKDSQVLVLKGKTSSDKINLYYRVVI